MEDQKTATESVVCVYKGDVLVAIVKRDYSDKNRRVIVHKTEEADIDEIVDLINFNPSTL